MRTELVPYGLIARVTIHAAHAPGAHVDFNLDHAPDVLAHVDPEAALRAAAALARHGPDDPRVADAPKRTR